MARNIKEYVEREIREEIALRWVDPTFDYQPAGHFEINKGTNKKPVWVHIGNRSTVEHLISKLRDERIKNILLKQQLEDASSSIETTT